jgi:hypothetical protein
LAEADFEQAKFSDVAFQEGLGKEPPDVVGDCLERFCGGAPGNAESELQVLRTNTRVQLSSR